MAFEKGFFVLFYCSFVLRCDIKEKHASIVRKDSQCRRDREGGERRQWLRRCFPPPQQNTVGEQTDMYEVCLRLLGGETKVECASLMAPLFSACLDVQDECCVCSHAAITLPFSKKNILSRNTPSRHFI